MTEQHRNQAIETVKDILHCLHEKRYEDLPKCVDQMDWMNPAEIREYVQGTLELNNMDTFDEYGVPCNFHPQYEYHQLHFYEREGLDRFELDYDLTSGGEMTDLCLQLGFVIQGEKLKRIFRMIDPM